MKRVDFSRTGANTARERKLHVSLLVGLGGVLRRFGRMSQSVCLSVQENVHVTHTHTHTERERERAFAPISHPLSVSVHPMASQCQTRKIGLTPDYTYLVEPPTKLHAVSLVLLLVGCFLTDGLGRTDSKLGKLCSA